MKKIFFLLLILTLSASCSVEVEESDDYGTSEGSPTSPLTLALDTAHSGKVAKWDYSYYSFTTSSTGAGTYELAFTSLAISDPWSSSKSIGMIRMANPIAVLNTESRPINICGHSD